MRALTPTHFLDQGLPFQQIAAPAAGSKKGTPQPTRAIDAVEIGSASNALTTLQGENNVVWANDSLNTVVFIHRNDASQFGLTSSQYRYAISTDRGANFLLNQGPLNPTANNDIPGTNARYPQCVIYNPSGNTDPNNAWLSYTGAWHNGSTGADTWEGLAYGVVRLNNDMATATEHYDIMDSSNVLIASSMCKGLQGEFWAVDNEFEINGDDDSLVIVYKGVWNSSTNDVEWTIFDKLNPGWATSNDSTFKLTPLIAFDPSGMKGWIGSCADFGSNTFFPYFYKTIDGGATWSGPEVVNLASFASVMDHLDMTNGTGVPTTAFDIDMVVDKNGDPHFGVVMGSGEAHAIQTGLSLNLYDVTYKNATSAWDVIRMDTVVAFRGNIGTTSTGADYTQDNRPQLSTSPDGSRVVFLWNDSPLSPGDNILPDLKGIAYNVDNMMWTSPVNFTDGSAWNGAATFPSASPVSFYANSCTNIPVVITKLNESLVSEDPATFHYFQNINICDDAYIYSVPNVSVEKIAKNDANLNLWPNPASQLVTITGLKNASADVKVIDVLGKTVQTHKTNGTDLLRFDVSSLPAGVYTVHVNGNGINSTRSFVVNR